MFDVLAIHFTAPICNCEEQKILWAINAQRSLVVWCETCMVAVIVPYTSMLAQFKFATPYPTPKVKPKTDLKVMDGGKVLEFKAQHSNQPQPNAEPAPIPGPGVDAT